MHLSRLIGHLDANLCEGVCFIIMTITLFLLLWLRVILQGQVLNICKKKKIIYMYIYIITVILFFSSYTE